MRLAASSVEFKSLGVEDVCKRISALGFQAVDFWNHRFGCPHMDEIKTRLGASGLRDTLDRNRLRLCSFTCYDVQFRDYVQSFSGFGAVAVRESRYGRFDDTIAAMRNFLESLRGDLDLAERHDTYIAIENHGGALLKTVDSIKAFVELNQHPRLGIALAPYHLQVIGAPVDQVIALCGRQLMFFYAWQNAEDLDQLPGIGPADATPWIAELAKAKYAGYIAPFMHGDVPVDIMSDSLRRSVEYLRSCHAKVRDAVPTR